MVNGSDLWYSDKGAGDVVFVIHGAGSGGRMWAKDLVPLARTHRVIAPNRRGFPGSGSAVRDWRVHGDDAAGLVAELDAAPVAVVAHSGGSIAALDLAVRRPVARWRRRNRRRARRAARSVSICGLSEIS